MISSFDIKNPPKKCIAGGEFPPLILNLTANTVLNQPFSSSCLSFCPCVLLCPFSFCVFSYHELHHLQPLHLKGNGPKCHNSNTSFYVIKERHGTERVTQTKLNQTTESNLLETAISTVTSTISTVTSTISTNLLFQPFQLNCYFNHTAISTKLLFQPN